MTQISADFKTGCSSCLCAFARDMVLLVLHNGVQNGEIGVLIPQSRDQSEDWRIAGVLKFEKAGK